MIRAVLDTNIIISALLWGGLPQQIFLAALDERFVMLSTEALLAELINTLSRDKFTQQLALRQLTVDAIAAQYRLAAVIVESIEVPTDSVRDPKDRAVLACGVSGKADFIVSGDKDLLVLGTYEGIAILSPDQFLQHLSSQ